MQVEVNASMEPPELDIPVEQQVIGKPLDSVGEPLTPKRSNSQNTCGI